MPFVKHKNKKETEKTTNSQYCFVDEIGVEQGPFDSNEILNWIRNGFFDGKGDLLFRNLTSSPAERVSLEQILPELLTETEINFSKKICPNSTININNPNTGPVEVKDIALVDDQIKLLEENDDQHKDLILVVKPSLKASDIQTQMQKTQSNISAIFLDKVAAINTNIVANQLEFKDEKCDISTSYLEKYAEQFYANEEFKGNDSSAFVPMLKISVHSSVLATSSPLLKNSMKTLFEEHFRLRERVAKGNCTTDEREQSLINPVLTIESDCPIAFQAIIRYMYGHTSEVLSMNKLLLVSMWKESRRFMLKKLEDELLIHLFSTKLDIIDLVEIAAAAAILKFPKLVDEIVTMIASCASYILQGPYLALSVDAYVKLIKNNYVMMDEIQVFYATQHFIQQKEVEVGLWTDSFEQNDYKKEIEIYKFVRYDQMSADELKSIRVRKLDSLILDATLKKLTNDEEEGRLRPWLPNSEYNVIYRDGEYPVGVVRSGKVNLGTNGAFQSRWAWTTGDSRFISEMTFAFKVLKSLRGKLRVGVCCTGKPVITETQNIRMSKVFYYDFSEKEFVSAFLGSNIFQCTSRIKSLDIRRENIKINEFKFESSIGKAHNNSSSKEAFGTRLRNSVNEHASCKSKQAIAFEDRIEKGQIYHLVVSIHDYSVLLRIESIDCGTYIENYYNHGFLVDRLEVSKKPYIETKIFIEMLDPGDSLTIPSFLTTARHQKTNRSK
ncbi:BTB/POZ and GYF domain-containing protein [Cryptosporidium canis]|uniref:BTB/POZ and GYF domain-containing protein n=1 Tax=Cryptosporidium canis TaxID=195482 RepID=A0A9D5DEA9_9CRYT|nr:BTB/POZ and GYF domain-containing protein [Cryptosporidium canis]